MGNNYMKFWQKLSSALRNKKIVLTALVVMIVVIVALVPKEAHAWWGIDYVVSGAIGWITFVVNYIIGFIAGIFFALGAFLVQWALGFNELILNNEVVQIGWSITLSFANLGFVLAIIIIAFATIFRMQSYAMKQTLWKLIVAALLVNFSLVIAGAFINVSDIATRSFQNASKLNPLTAADTLGAAFNTQRLIAVSGESCFWYQEDIVIGVFKNSGGMCKKSEEGTTKPGTLGKFRCDCNLKAALQEIKEKTGGNLSGEFLTMIASLFFSVVFSILGIITLLAIFVMLLIRYVALGFILVLSPLAWLCWIFPSTQSLWKKWWDNFLRWTFFAPIMSFFMYLAIKSLESMPMLTDVEVQEILSGTFDQPGFLENVSSMLILIGFMLGGLYVANSLSITGASTAMGFAKDAGKWAGGAVGGMAGKGAKGIGKRILTSGAKKDAVTGEITTRGQRLAAKLSNVPVLRGVASKISNITSSKARKEEVEKYAKDNLANLSNDAIVNQANAKMAFLNPVKASALGQELAKRNLTDRIDPALVKKYISTATKLGAEEPILNNRPDLSDDKLKTMSKIKAGKADEIHHKAFEDVDIVVSLDNSKLERLSKEGSTQQKDTIVNSIKTTLGSALAPIETVRDYIEKTKKGITDAQATGDTALTTALIFERDRLIADEKTLISGLGAREQKLLKHHDFISNNVNWQV